MAKVDKKIKRNYTLELTEVEYYVILCLVGGASYDEFRDSVNKRYSIRLGREETEDFEIATSDDFNRLYYMLEDSK
ncbi:hypothetical protein [Cytobacillus praedii]|uniref:Uncharacterized protein n=1 Tax=Cytobacillus praedii TaxID=1742358 RepID=A0A4R1ASZ8_9BACI|nr:hypothetical protein [Cytobacillus praedii]TCI99958.1 hypothetical protein E0Y62_27175 [Cytobacillus praedii]